MDTLKFDLSKKAGEFKIMNAVNNGPCHKRRSNDQFKSNFETYKAAKIPYARNHDAAFWSGYGGEHSVDITGIFPDFDADPYDPASYNFATTDEYILVTLDAGAETYYRLGQKIEHYVKKFGTIPPKDFKKWAVICEHIIRHYNCGWANGFNLNIQYWEIWNEPDLDSDDSANKRCWGGTAKEFYELYAITAAHLKKRFPNLKIGGPALASSSHREWMTGFFERITRDERIPLDFFSWHLYSTDPNHIYECARTIRETLDKYGYTETESILNEWNYVKGWTDEFIYSIKTIIGIKGAAFTMACMSIGQASPVDMLMYYDARPCCFNGLFDFYTLRPLKGYYPFKWYGMLRDMKAEIKCETAIPDIYTLCGCDENEKLLSVITYYTDKENEADKTFNVDFCKDSEYEIYLLDSGHDAELVDVTKELILTMKPNTCIMIKEK